YVEQCCYRAHALAALAGQCPACALQGEIRGGQRARAELVLEPVDVDAVEPAIGVARFHAEQAERVVRAAVFTDPREREGHFRGGRGSEPLRAVKLPSTVVPAACDGPGVRNVRSAGALR